MNKYIEKETLAYFAGFFDGEGCISLWRRKKKGKKIKSHGFMVRLNNTNPFPLKKGQKIFGGSYGIVKYQALHFPRKKPVWEWRLTGKSGEFFLRQIVDYLIIKKEEVLLILEYRETILKSGKRINREVITPELFQKRENIAEKMRECKHREWIM